MKRCPECRRDFSDDTLSFCLDDGTRLVDGPANDEPTTVLLTSPRERPDEPATNTIAKPMSGASHLNPGGKSNQRLVWPLLALLVFLIPLAGFIGYRYLSPASQIESIAVMPFLNESGNPDVEYLSDGMTETLISNLSQIPNLNVKARSSVFRYKGKEVGLRTIGKELGVQALLTGTVVQRGSSLVLHIELVDAVTENALWSSDYNSPMTNLLSLQSEVASDVSQRLKAKLSRADKQKLARNYTDNPEAYQLYLRGRFYWNKRTADENKKAVEYFEQAIASDPTYALAYAALADSYILQLPSITREERFSKARAAAMKALEIDETLGEAHTALAEVEVDAWNWPAAERGFKRAIELNSNYPTARHWNAELLSRLGRHDEAIREIKRAHELDPLSIPINTMVGHVLMMAGRYDEAIEQFKKTLEMDRNFALATGWLSKTYIYKGMYEEAISELEKRPQGTREQAESREKNLQYLAELKNAYKSSGEKGFWERDLRQMTLRQARGENLRPHRMAEIYSNLGDNDKAFEWLDAVVKERGGDGYLKVDPAYERVRNDPRFQELLRKGGFSP